MSKKNKFLFLLIVFLVVFNLTIVILYLLHKQNNAEAIASNESLCIGEDENFDITFIKTNNQGLENEQGVNKVVIFNPRSRNLDFQVHLPLDHELYAKDTNGNLRKEYVKKTFSEFMNDDKIKLKQRLPIAAINGDFIGDNGQPEGLNISRGTEYSGDAKKKRSSFAISEAKPEERQATIQVGKREENNHNYNIVGGNGRFYQEGEFKDICEDLGEFACQKELSRSMAAITAKGHVILLVNDAELGQELMPGMFDEVLKGIAVNHCLGEIEEGMLFAGGTAVGLYFDNQVYVEKNDPVGSVFSIYKVEPIIK
ncbi:MAG: phosphodiester glycosidase family protein [Spirulinaceae cyanobacterium]